MSKIQTSSEAITRGLKISVESRFLPEQSSAPSRQFAFAYRVRIENRGSDAVTLRTRRWQITDGSGEERVVEGDGVVGQQPTLLPGQAFEYTSGAVLPTARGQMQGSYRFTCSDGTSFDAEIAPFSLEQPYSLN